MAKEKEMKEATDTMRDRGIAARLLANGKIQFLNEAMPWRYNRYPEPCYCACSKKEQGPTWRSAAFMLKSVMQVE